MSKSPVNCRPSELSLLVLGWDVIKVLLVNLLNDFHEILNVITMNGHNVVSTACGADLFHAQVSCFGKVNFNPVFRFDFETHERDGKQNDNIKQ